MTSLAADQMTETKGSERDTRETESATKVGFHLLTISFSLEAGVVKKKQSRAERVAASNTKEKTQK